MSENDLLDAKFKNCPINGTATVSQGEVGSWDAFEAIAARLEVLDEQGVIEIKERKYESQSGHRKVSLIRFERLE